MLKALRFLTIGLTLLGFPFVSAPVFACSINDSEVLGSLAESGLRAKIEKSQEDARLAQERADRLHTIVRQQSILAGAHLATLIVALPVAVYALEPHAMTTAAESAIHLLVIAYELHHLE